MSAVLGQPLVVENRAGAGGMVGTAYLARLPADGYSALFTTASHAAIPPFHDSVGYDPVKDFTHVTLAAQNFGQALVVHPSVPAKICRNWWRSPGSRPENSPMQMLAWEPPAIFPPR